MLTPGAYPTPPAGYVGHNVSGGIATPSSMLIGPSPTGRFPGVPSTTLMRGSSSLGPRAHLSAHSSFAAVMNATTATAKDPFGTPPPGYIPGRGRGAVGFAGGVSRDDSFAAGGGGAIGTAAVGAAIDAMDRGDYSDRNYDEFSGYAESLFQDTVYDEDDMQADRIYDAIDLKMDERRRSRREEKMKSTILQMRKEKPNIHSQFSDLRPELSTVTKAEWEGIPDIGDTSLRGKKHRRYDRHSTAPDSLLRAARDSLGYGHLGSGSVAISDMGTGFTTGGESSTGIQTPLGVRTPLVLPGLHFMSGTETPTNTMDGWETPVGLKTPIGVTGGAVRPGRGTSSLLDVSEARGTLLTVKLDTASRAPESVAPSSGTATSNTAAGVRTSSSVDPVGYLTSLESFNAGRRNIDIGDLKKARTLLKSVINTNRKHAPGWIAAARLEETAGRLQAARDIILRGAEECPKSEDLWLEAVRLAKPADVPVLLAKAIIQLPTSVRLWLEAAAKETNEKKKILVLRKAVSKITNSVRLWENLVALEDPPAAKICLSRAVECVPQSVELWLALARLSDYKDAKMVLNEARKKVPTSFDIWIAACQLEESNNPQITSEALGKMIVRGIDKVSELGIVLERENLMNCAVQSEKEAQCPKTAAAIIKATMNIGVDESRRAEIWLEESNWFVEKQSIQCAKAMLTSCLETLKTNEDVWLAAINLENKFGTPESVDEVLENAVKFLPSYDIFWLMAAKQKWLRGDVDGARQIFAKAYDRVENRETISLAAIKVERESLEFERARSLLMTACEQVNTVNVWMQRVQLERQLREFDAAEKLIAEALDKFPKSWKLWLIAAHIQMEKDPPDNSRALKFLENGSTHCPRSVEIALALIDVLMALGETPKARAKLESAHMRLHFKNDLLWLKSIEMELKDGHTDNANYRLSRGLQECPTSPHLWAQSIWLAAPAERSSKAAAALEGSGNAPECALAVAELFWQDKRLIKARKWFETALSVDSSIGDIWGTFLAFEIEQKNEERQKSLIDRCVKAEPNKGLKWNKVVKKVENWGVKYPVKLGAYLEAYFPKLYSSLEQVTSPAVFQLLRDRRSRQPSGEHSQTSDDELLRNTKQVKRKAED